MTILSKFKTNWEEFIVKDENWNTRLDINTITASDKVILVTLNMSTYVGYNQTGYSIPGFDRGITEQEAYNIWIQDFQNNQRTLIRQLKDFGLPSIPQCVYDGLILYYIINAVQPTILSLSHLIILSCIILALNITFSLNSAHIYCTLNVCWPIENYF